MDMRNDNNDKTHKENFYSILYQVLLRSPAAFNGSPPVLVYEILKTICDLSPRFIANTIFPADKFFDNYCVSFYNTTNKTSIDGLLDLTALISKQPSADQYLFKKDGQPTPFDMQVFNRPSLFYPLFSVWHW